MTEPHVHVCLPYESIGEYLPFVREERLNLEIYFGSKCFDDLKKDNIIELKKKLDYNPKLTIHSPFMDLSPAAIDPRIREVTFERFSNILDFAEILEPSVIVFHSGFDKKKYDRRINVWIEGSQETWVPLNKRAVDMDVKIAIENIFEDDPENLKLLVEEINSKNFGICFDTGHFNLFSQISLTEWLNRIRPYIIELHLHDNDGITDGHLAIGDGNFDFHTLFKELREINCVYTIEAHTVENVKKSLKRLPKFIGNNLFFHR